MDIIDTRGKTNEVVISFLGNISGLRSSFVAGFSREGSQNVASKTREPGSAKRKTKMSTRADRADANNIPEV